MNEHEGICRDLPHPGLANSRRKTCDVNVVVVVVVENGAEKKQREKEAGGGRREGGKGNEEQLRQNLTTPT